MFDGRRRFTPTASALRGTVRRFVEREIMPKVGRWEMTNPPPNPLADREQRLALFQMWFSDTIPHSKALGIRIVDARRGFASMRLDWREELVGNPETGVLAGGPLTALLDGCCGMAVATLLKEPKPFATLDLRIDYVRPATPGQAVIAEAECYRITHSVAFTRAFAHHGDARDPIAAAAGTFMLGTKGQVTRPQSIGSAAIGLETKP